MLHKLFNESETVVFSITFCHVNSTIAVLSVILFAICHSPFSGKCQSLTSNVCSYLVIQIQLLIFEWGGVMMDFLAGNVILCEIVFDTVKQLTSRLLAEYSLYSLGIFYSLI